MTSSGAMLLIHFLVRLPTARIIHLAPYLDDPQEKCPKNREQRVAAAADHGVNCLVTSPPFTYLLSLTGRRCSRRNSGVNMRVSVLKEERGMNPGSLHDSAEHHQHFNSVSSFLRGDANTNAMTTNPAVPEYRS